MIPVHAFLEGDTLGILLLLDDSDTVDDLVEKLQRSSRLRVARREGLRVIHRGVELDRRLAIAGSAIGALDRIDVVPSAFVVREAGK